MRYKATHRLKKDFVVNSKEIYRKGTSLAKPPLHKKHSGLCCNVLFLSEDGYERTSNQGQLSLFSFDHFRPFKDWFEPIM
jgi:hypothetical protein